MKNAQEKKLLLENICRVPIIQAACEKSGISRATFYRWREKDHEFAHEVDQALSEGVLFVNDLAESKVIRGIKENKPNYVLYWLRNRHPAYANRIRLSPDTHEEIQLTSEEQELVRHALLLASSSLPMHGELSESTSATSTVSARETIEGIR